MKTDTVFKRAFNDSLDLLTKLVDGGELPSENVLRKHLNVSRTTVRKVLDRFEQAGAVSRVDGRRVVRSGRSARKLIKFSDAETVPRSAQVEQRFMEWMLRDNAQAGTAINELDLARRFGFATTSIREFLNRFQRFGLIEKRPNAGWVFMGFTPDFALELFEIREMFELRSAKAFALLPSESPLWQRMKAIRGEHVALLREVNRRYHDFSDLDSRFHRLINAAAPNRFIDGFYDIISFIFHYHYQWNKHDERQRNEVAIREHLTYIDALVGRNLPKVERACRAHLTSARETLMRSTLGEQPVTTRRSGTGRPAVARRHP
jgi:DNA-binding GntR family transcriptional regulator